MACRLPNRRPPHEPSIVVDPRLYFEALEALDVAPDPRQVPSECPDDPARVPVLRAALLVLLSACASYAGVRLLRAELPRTAHAELVVTPLAPPEDPTPRTPVVLPLPLPRPAAPMPASAPAWLQRVHEARALLAGGQLDQAEAVFRAILAQRAEVPAAQMGLARVRLARGDCSEASTLAAAVLARMPQHRGAREILAACLRAEGTAARDVAPQVAAVRAALPPNPF